MNANTMKAINRRLDAGENAFYIGKYFYDYDSISGRLRRREQTPGYTPTSDWEVVPVNAD